MCVQIASDIYQQMDRCGTKQDLQVIIIFLLLLYVLDLIFYLLSVQILLRYLFVVLKQLHLKMISPKTHEETLLHD